jgi:hypothetical protein
MDTPPTATDRTHTRRLPSMTHVLHVEYSDEEVAFLRAVDTYKTVRRRPFPTCTELLAIVHALGYRKVEPAAPLPEFRIGVKGW